MTEKTFCVHCGSMHYWTAIVRARSKREAKDKAQKGGHDDIDDEMLAPGCVVYSIEEVSE
jgi:hypothetical protein